KRRGCTPLRTRRLNARPKTRQAGFAPTTAGTDKQSRDHHKGGCSMALITGSNRNDILNGTAADDEMYGLAGNDVIRGRGGNDRLFGQISNDRLEGGAGDDLLSGDVELRIWGTSPDGTPLLVGDTLDYNVVRSNDHLAGGTGNDIVVGDAVGLAGNARGGDDFIAGGSGDDYLFGDAANGAVPRPPPPDVTEPVYIPDVGITGDAVGGNDVIRGGAGNDFIFGDAATFGSGYYEYPSNGRGGN